MNKQFLSLLLLTSFVGTTSPMALTGLETLSGFSHFAPAVQALGGTVKIATPGLFSTLGSKATGLMSVAGSKATGLMAAAGSKVAGLSATSQGALIATPLVGAGVATGTVLSNGVSVSEGTAQTLANLGAAFGKSSTVSIREAVTAANFAARPWYTKAGESVVAAASAVKASAANATQAVVAAAKSHPKSAIVAGVAAAGALGYLGYRYFTSSRSISLTEQEAVKFGPIMAQAQQAGKRVFHNPSVMTPVIVKPVFTTETTGLPNKVVVLLNEYVAVAHQLSNINCVVRGNKINEAGLEYKRSLEARLAQVIAKLPVAA